MKQNIMQVNVKFSPFKEYQDQNKVIVYAVVKYKIFPELENEFDREQYPSE